MALIRAFFVDRGLWEVETPILSQGTVTDLHLDAFKANFHHHQSGKVIPLYLQTSPEFAMKRLLAAGSGAIFQITKAFRDETAGRFHNPEFSLLEWYQPDYTAEDLMAEIDALLQRILDTPGAIIITYQQAFINYLSLDPLLISLEELKIKVSRLSSDDWLQQETNKDTLLQWLFSSYIEPKLGCSIGYSEQGDLNKKITTYKPCFVYQFPASQASLSKLNESDPRVSERFELYYKGIELANGFLELQDAQEQYQRFAMDNKLRQAQGLPVKPIDAHFIQALESGLPDCAGVALGLDRLFMIYMQINSISETLSFDINRA